MMNDSPGLVKRSRDGSGGEDADALSKNVEKNEKNENDDKRGASGKKEQSVVYTLTMITFVVVLPYVLYMSYLWLVLQSGMFGDTVILPTSVRQVLIVGTQSSGTTQMSRDLNAIGLEVAHESSEASWSFARDGTISWFHGIRFLRRPQREEVASYSINWLCSRARRNIGFHPAMYRVPPRDRQCSYRIEWDECWEEECRQLLNEEWGCAWREQASSSNSSSISVSVPSQCEIPFVASLLQVRHPLRTIESLVVKFCSSVYAEAPQSVEWMSLLQNLWPEEDDWGANCASIMAKYWYNYNIDMINAYDHGLINGIYQIESTHPCEVANLAKVIGNETYIVRPEIANRVFGACSDVGTHPSLNRKEIANQRNRGVLTLNWNTFKRQNDSSFVDRLKHVSEKLGYYSDDPL